ncbi:uncharacterized protein EV154DRAFT_257636 [Mucor mucedo]|uniref:uncharacterized protein n=1 Tax=Mucor mucedo TaxID=29922 RepID=UPI002220DF80|nr:uncharacterized protein EV154DRAFT_257636 [Mucor mucedo]KAI7896175.1 hypothetical protein EV154DRAFT_257636 [Mucor mucedo]
MSRSRPLSTKHSSTKRKQSAYHNDDCKDQTLPKNKRAKLTPDLYMMSLFFVDREARSCTENNGGLPLSGMYSEVSQIGRMVSDYNNDADDDSYVDTETTEDTNGISDYDDDADEDYDINDDNGNDDDDNDETAEQPIDNSDDDDDNNETAEQPIDNSDDDDGSDTNGDEAGDEQEEEEQAGDEQVEDERAAVLQGLAGLRERIDRLDAHINTAMTNIHDLDYRVEIVLAQIDITHDRMTYLRDQITNVEITSREINNRVALLPTRENLNEVTANANMHQANNTRRMDGFDVRFDQVMELLHARLPERNVENVAADGNNRDNLQPPIINNLPALNDNNQLDADANQPQADINQQQAGDPQQEQVPVANDDQQEQDPPLNGPPGNGGEGVNINGRTIAIQQFIYVRNMEFY